MWQALGALLPIAVAVAVSSVPITVTILLLLSPNRSKTALPFLIGWVIGVVAVMGVSALSAQALPTVPRRAQEEVTGALELLIGAALIVLGVVQIRRRSRTSAAGMPHWLTAVDSFNGAGVLCGWRCPQSPAQRLAPRYYGRPRPPCGAQSTMPSLLPSSSSTR